MPRIDEIIKKYITKEGGYTGDVLIILEAMASLQKSIDNSGCTCDY